VGCGIQVVAKGISIITLFLALVACDPTNLNSPPTSSLNGPSVEGMCPSQISTLPVRIGVKLG